MTDKSKDCFKRRSINNREITIYKQCDKTVFWYALVLLNILSLYNDGKKENFIDQTDQYLIAKLFLNV